MRIWLLTFEMVFDSTQTTASDHLAIEKANGDGTGWVWTGTRLICYNDNVIEAIFCKQDRILPAIPF